jgi:hypothetical protein
MTSIARNLSNKVPYQFCQCSLLGNSPIRLGLIFHWVWFAHKIETVFFAGYEGIYVGFYEFKLGKIKMFWDQVIRVRLMYVQLICYFYVLTRNIYIMALNSPKRRIALAAWLTSFQLRKEGSVRRWWWWIYRHRNGRGEKETPWHSAWFMFLVALPATEPSSYSDASGSTGLPHKASTIYCIVESRWATLSSTRLSVTLYC